MNTDVLPEVISPASALSPIRATLIPSTYTFGEPAFTVATCGPHAGTGGNGWETVGSPIRAMYCPVALTVDWVGEARVVVPAQA